MKSRTAIGGEIIFFVIVAFIFWPWVIFVTDAMFWMVTGDQVSKVPWFSIRGLVLVLWPAALSYILTRFVSKL